MGGLKKEHTEELQLLRTESNKRMKRLEENLNEITRQQLIDKENIYEWLNKNIR